MSCIVLGARFVMLARITVNNTWLLLAVTRESAKCGGEGRISLGTTRPMNARVLSVVGRDGSHLGRISLGTVSHMNARVLSVVGRDRSHLAPLGIWMQ
ncbi:hypothetical protein QYF36_024526 [Acer negundo]|nr:hypothetical protein QYF36_024526 [Acer negundo]